LLRRNRCEEFYCGALGLDVTRRAGATFISSGGYHHHVAVNTWHSSGAGARNGERAGLDWFSMEINDQPTIDGLKKRLGAAGATIDAIPGGFAAVDPWGTRIRFTIAPENAAQRCHHARLKPLTFCSCRASRPARQTSVQSDRARRLLHSPGYASPCSTAQRAFATPGASFGRHHP
jgi:hypothetical protein